ncbi:MAG TPA: hypothetical protein VLE93_01515 [Candidatus Saccharimonadales bacterium]|nr:hypothetical protein [Candidatus Saccharimonadales bacterium]
MRWPFSRKAVKVSRLVEERVKELLTKKEPSAGLVKVTTCFDVSRTDNTEHIVAEADLLTFLTATLQLHYEPGKNPHNGNGAAEVQYITIAALRPSGPYWWATPGLQNNYDDRGAITFDWNPYPTVIWQRPGVELPRFLKS